MIKYLEENSDPEGICVTIKELTEIISWLKNNSKRRLTEEEKNWAKQEIDKAETFRDLAKAVLGFMRTGS
ncbi:MAG: hypothetical protein J6P48_04440 [Oscillospiraceae bacterium]|nr:hypothetical protein [Oscillospiraceae bacterium]